MLNAILSQKEIEEIKSIVELVFQGADFIALKEDSDCEYYLSENEDDFLSLEDFRRILCENEILNIHVASGLTKIVLIPDDKDYVIKIPITKTGYYDYIEDENGNYTKGNLLMENNNLGDYCSIEEELFNSFTDDIQKIFAETRFITKVNDLPIYIQEKVTVPYCKKINQFDPNHYPSDRKSDMDIHYELSAISEYSEYNEFQEDFCYDILVNYGFDFLVNLLQTIDYAGISDLHAGNYGYKNYKPMIYDYSGYGE